MFLASLNTSLYLPRMATGWQCWMTLEFQVTRSPAGRGVWRARSVEGGETDCRFTPCLLSLPSLLPLGLVLAQTVFTSPVCLGPAATGSATKARWLGLLHPRVAFPFFKAGQRG